MTAWAADAVPVRAAMVRVPAVRAAIRIVRKAAVSAVAERVAMVTAGLDPAGKVDQADHGEISDGMIAAASAVADAMTVLISRCRCRKFR